MVHRIARPNLGRRIVDLHDFIPQIQHYNSLMHQDVVTIPEFLWASERRNDSPDAKNFVVIYYVQN